MSDYRKQITLISDGKPGGVTEMHYACDDLKTKAKSKGFNVSDCDIKNKKEYSKGKAKNS